VGAGSLSIWTHYLKSFEFLPEYTQGEYNGMAVRFGAGLEGWDMFDYMDKFNITVVAPGDRSVGMGGGWVLDGGHGLLTSMYGVGSDSVLSMQVVTADGRFVTADPDTNEDLFWAMRGGGGGKKHSSGNPEERHFKTNSCCSYLRGCDIYRYESLSSNKCHDFRSKLFNHVI
jgi:hypothetical protein